MCYWNLFAAPAEQHCELNCRAKGFRFYVRQSDRVIDGTPCGQNETFLCVAGMCTVSILFNSKRKSSRRKVCFFSMIYRCDLQWELYQLSHAFQRFTTQPCHWGHQLPRLFQMTSFIHLWNIHRPSFLPSLFYNYPTSVHKRTWMMYKNLGRSVLYLPTKFILESNMW